MKAKILDIQKLGNRFRIVLDADEVPEDFESTKEYVFTISSASKKKRTLDQNALFWACIGEMSRILNIGTDELALKMVHEYGPFEIVAIPTAAIDSFKRMWKDTEVINSKGNTTWLKCFYGTSKLNSKEFARLIEGVKREAMDADIPLRHGEEIDRWIQSFNQKKSASSAKG